MLRNRTLVLSAFALAFLSHCAPVKSGFRAIGESDPSQAASSIPVDQSPVVAPTPEPSSTPTPAPAMTPTPVPVDPGRASSAPNLTVCANATTLPGIDVSDYDPNTKWSQIKIDGDGFTFIKATEGVDFTNEYFATDWKAAPAAGLLRGAYHFFHPGDDPLTQAQFYLKTMGTLQNTDLPPMLDWEVADGVNSATQIANAKIWLNAVEKATGKVPVIYVDYSFWNSLGNPTGFQRYPLFIAHYDVSCPTVPPPWSKWTFWQKGTGPVNGVQSTDADMDLFNGTATQLLNFAKTGSF